MKLEVVINGLVYVPREVECISCISLPTYLKAMRKDLRWTLDEAAESIGCSKSHVFDMESGASEPSLRMACAIARAYNVPIETLAAALQATKRGEPA